MARGSSPKPHRGASAGTPVASKATAKSKPSHRVQDALPPIKPSAEELEAPAIAWPTVILTVASTAGWLLSMRASLSGTVPYPLALAGMSICVYLMFTPMHDAAHGSVFNNAGGLRRANGLVGRIASLPFGPFVAFRHIHLQHHKHTNHEGLDPDMYSGRGAFWQLPLRWATQDFHYYLEYLPKLPRRPWRESVEVVLYFGALFSIGHWPVVGPLGPGTMSDIFWYWAMPGRIAFAFLAFSFDYLPHRPHQDQNRYRGTSNLALKADGTGMAALTPLLLYQNYHAIHHLWPYIPFYRYSQIWYKHRPEFAERGTIIRGLFPIFVPVS